MSRCVAALLVVAPAAALTGPPALAAAPEVWLCAGGGVLELLREDAEWPFAKENLSGLKLYIDQIDKASPAQLAALVQLVDEQEYQVAVECGCCLDFGPMDDTNGEWSAKLELAKIDKWYAAGGKVDFLDLDGPVRRLMFPDGRGDGQSFDSMERAADEVVDAVRLFREAYPEIRFWHLTNFPNWGYKGDVSYHARGPARQDYGEYDDAHRLVYEKLKEAGIPLAGVTIDNPYDYLIGEHFSVSIADPKSIDWLGRVRAYEDRCREEGLEVNLIVNSERGGQQSDQLFCEETLRMVDTYLQAGGRPTRWLVQTWYPHPKQIVPETAPFTMTGLVKAVIEHVRAGSETAASGAAGGGLIEDVVSALGDSLLGHRAALRVASGEAWRNWPRIGASLPGGGELLIELPEFVLGTAERVGPGGLILSGRSTMTGLCTPLQPPLWRGTDARFALDVPCSGGITGRYTIAAGPGRVDIECELTNRTGGPLTRVEQFLCASVTADSGFWNPDPRSSGFFVGAEHVSWDALTDLDKLWRRGMKEDEGVQWLKAPVARVESEVPVHPQQAVVQGVVDCAVITQEHQQDADLKMVLVAEPGGSVFKNARTGCLHANPWSGTIPDSATSRARCTILLCRAADVAQLLRRAVGARPQQQRDGVEG